MATRKIRKRGSGAPRERITAQHISRLDVEGNPQVKVFTREAWDAIPETKYFDKTGIHHHAKGGWVEAKNVEVPKRLKKPEETKKGEAPKKEEAKAPVAPVTDPSKDIFD